MGQGVFQQEGNVMKNFYRTAISLALGLFAASAFAQDLDAIVETCNGCHGDDGVSQWTDIPTIAGMPEFVHADALFIYLDGARPCETTEFRQGDTSRAATSMCDVVADIDEGRVDRVHRCARDQPDVEVAHCPRPSGVRARGFSRPAPVGSG